MNWKVGHKKIDTVIIITPTTAAVIFVLYTNFSFCNFSFLRHFFNQCLPLGGKCWQCHSENFESRFRFKNKLKKKVIKKGLPIPAFLVTSQGRSLLCSASSGK